MPYRMPHPNIFISGPMSNRPNYNLRAFCDAHVALKSAGAGTVYNPALCWLQEPNQISVIKTHADYMRECLHELSRTDENGNAFYDIVAQLDQWEGSAGAKTEAIAAEAMNIPTIPIEKTLEILKARKWN